MLQHSSRVVAIIWVLLLTPNQRSRSHTYTFALKFCVKFMFFAYVSSILWWNLLVQVQILWYIIWMLLLNLGQGHRLNTCIKFWIKLKFLVFIFNFLIDILDNFSSCMSINWYLLDAAAYQGQVHRYVRIEVLCFEWIFWFWGLLLYWNWVCGFLRWLFHSAVVLVGVYVSHCSLHLVFLAVA